MTLGQNDTTNTNDIQMITNNVVEVVEEEKNISADATKNEDCINFYMENINPLITQYEIETLNDYNNDLSSDLIINAIKEAIEHKARNLKYVKKILDRYISNGITSLKQLELQEKVNKDENKKKETLEEQIERYKREWGLEDED